MAKMNKADGQPASLLGSSRSGVRQPWTPTSNQYVPMLGNRAAQADQLQGGRLVMFATG
jgi:hypothetical protein